MKRFRQQRREFEPVYRRVHTMGSLRKRAEEALACLEACRLCPRGCGAERVSGQWGQCRTGRLAAVACAFAHHGEERVLRGTCGSGTVFFTQCNLHCVFCQNYETSHGQEGQELTAEELAQLFLGLEAAGCHNVNLVTPSHVVPQILEALPLAMERGFHSPLVYNTSGYDSLDTLRLLEGVVDLYMPDFKLWSVSASERYLLAGDYPAVAREAVREMYRQVGDLVVDERGIALRGLLVRHLVMPGMLDDTAAILGFLARDVSVDTYLNLMAQYYPAGQVPGSGLYASIDRGLERGEFNQARRLALRAGFWRLDPWPDTGWEG